MRTPFLVAAVSLLFGCTGPTGPQGVAGPSGDSGPGTFFTCSGILHEADKISSSNSWKIKLCVDSLADNAVVQTWVKSVGEGWWHEPTWYLAEDSAYIMILDDEKVFPEFEYKVVGIIP